MPRLHFPETNGVCSNCPRKTGYTLKSKYGLCDLTEVLLEITFNSTQSNRAYSKGADAYNVNHVE